LVPGGRINGVPNLVPRGRGHCDVLAAVRASVWDRVGMWSNVYTYDTCHAMRRRRQEAACPKWHALGRVSTWMWVWGDSDPVKRPIGQSSIEFTGLLRHACSALDVLRPLKVTGVRWNDGGGPAVGERNGVPM
jgi:hypothetical protein